MRLLNTTDPTLHIPKSSFIQPYISIKPTGRTAAVLDAFSKSVKFLPAALPRQELHITVMYATNETDIDRLKYILKPAIQWIVTPKEMTIFSDIDSDSCHLVMEIECDRLKDYNQYVKDALGLNTSFADYKPHITFASNPHKDKSYSPAHKRGCRNLEHALEVFERAKDEMNEALKENKPELFFSGMRFERARS